jgi:hypothetical protein
MIFAIDFADYAAIDADAIFAAAAIFRLFIDADAIIIFRH